MEKLNFNVLEDCMRESNKIIFIEDKTLKIIDGDERLRNELLTVDKYIEYSSHTYDNEIKGYTIYNIKDRIIDKNNNLILCGEYEYINK